MTTLKDLEAKIASQNESIATLQKAYDDLKKDARMMATGDSPASMQIAYSPELKSKVFEKAAFFRFLESKGRVDDNFGSTYAGFYKEVDASLASWIDENDDIPAANASSYQEDMSKMKTLIHPIDVSLMAQMGNNAIDILAKEIDKGFIKVTNELDDALLQGTGTSAAKNFKGFTKQVSSNVETMNEGEVISEDVIDDMLTTIIDENGGTVDALVTTNGVAKQLKKIVAPYRRFNDKIDIGLGHRVVAYEAPNGAEIPILIDSNLKQESNKDLMLFADSSTIEVKRLLPPTLMTNLPTNKLGTKNAVVSFATANVTAEFCNGMIKGIDTSLEVENPYQINIAAAQGTG
ncbi:SU10 major capsid protein [Methanobrevibacter sp.]